MHIVPNRDFVVLIMCNNLSKIRVVFFFYKLYLSNSKTWTCLKWDNTPCSKFEFNFEEQPIIQLSSNDDFNKTRF
jgi:hypothetical protein